MIERKQRPKHKKNPELGEKTVIYGPCILLEQEDAQTFSEGEEITLMDWGNAFVEKIDRDDKNIITTLKLTLHLEGDFKKTEKKVTWLADTEDKTLVEIHVFDYLITKDKLDPEDNFEDFVNEKTDKRSLAFSDCNIRDLPERKTIQFERKGYFVCDQAFNGEKAVMFDVPDGKIVNRYGAKPGSAAAVKNTSTAASINDKL